MALLFFSLTTEAHIQIIRSEIAINLSMNIIMCLNVCDLGGNTFWYACIRRFCKISFDEHHECVGLVRPLDDMVVLTLTMTRQTPFRRVISEDSCLVAST